MLHNPDNVNPGPGYRLLEDFEIQPGPILDEIKMYDKEGNWFPFGSGSNPAYSYRTKLSPSALRAARLSLGQKTSPPILEAKPETKSSLWLRRLLLILINILCFLFGYFLFLK